MHELFVSLLQTSKNFIFPSSWCSWILDDLAPDPSYKKWCMSPGWGLFDGCHRGVIPLEWKRNPFLWSLENWNDFPDNSSKFCSSVHRYTSTIQLVLGPQSFTGKVLMLTEYMNIVIITSYSFPKSWVQVGLWGWFNYYQPSKPDKNIAFIFSFVCFLTHTFAWLFVCLLTTQEIS